MERIFIHNEVEDLRYFKDLNGINGLVGNNRIVSYAMQKENIVGVFYTMEQARKFYEVNKYKENLPVIYFWNEELYNKRNK